MTALAKRRRAPTLPKLSHLERTFALVWRVASGPPYEPEYYFAKPRRWRFDCAWPAAKVAVELEGGIWTGGRHTRGAGFQADAEKYNAAVAMGWAVLRFTERDLRLRPFEVVQQVRRLIDGRTAKGAAACNP